MSEVQKTPEAAPKQEAQKDFKQVVKDAIQDKRLTKEERGEIIKLVNQMDQEKVKVNQETINELKKFATENGYSGFNWNLEKSLQSAWEKKAAAPEGNKKPEPAAAPAEAETKPTEAPTEAATKPTEAPTKPTEAPTSAPEQKKEEPKKQETSMMDKAGNFFTGKLDLSALPKEDQATIKDLQDAGFKLKPVEGKKGEYTVDMNGLGDKSKIDLAKKQFTTDALKSGGNDFTTKFSDSKDATDKMTKVNSLINTNLELKNIPELSGQRDLVQQEPQYQKLTAQKATLEKDLGIAAPAPAAAWAEWGK